MPGWAQTLFNYCIPTFQDLIKRKDRKPSKTVEMVEEDDRVILLSHGAELEDEISNELRAQGDDLELQPPGSRVNTKY